MWLVHCVPTISLTMAGDWRRPLRVSSHFVARAQQHASLFPKASRSNAHNPPRLARWHPFKPPRSLVRGSAAFLAAPTLTRGVCSAPEAEERALEEGRRRAGARPG